MIVNSVKLFFNLKAIKFICFNFIKLSKMYKSIMDEENKSKVWKIIQVAGDYVEGLNIKHNPLLQNLFFVFVGPSLNT